MRLVVTCLTLAVVRGQGTAATRTQIDDTCVVAGIVIRAVGILIVTVGIVIVDVLQCRLVVSILVAVAGTQIILIEVVCHPAIFEVIVCITLFGSTIHSIDDRGGAFSGCCAWSRIILKAAVVGTHFFVTTKGSNVAVFQTEVVDFSLVRPEECLVLAEAFQHMTVAVEGSLEHGICSIDIVCDGQVVLQDELGIFAAIIRFFLQVFLESRQVAQVLDVDARLRKILWLTLGTSLCCLLSTLHCLRNMQVHLVRLRIHLLVVVNHQGIG